MNLYIIGNTRSGGKKKLIEFGGRTSVMKEVFSPFITNLYIFDIFKDNSLTAKYNLWLSPVILNYIFFKLYNIFCLPTIRDKNPHLAVNHIKKLIKPRITPNTCNLF